VKLNRVETGFKVNQNLFGMDEDQAEELEALEAIFPGDLLVTCRDKGHIALELTLHASDDQAANYGAATHASPHLLLTDLHIDAYVCCLVSACLCVLLPAEYPKVVPVISIRPLKGLSEVQVEELQTLADK
jgi:RWD domain